jgi:type II secretory pathway component PulM
MTKREKTIGLFVGVVAGLFALDQILFTPLLSRLDAADKLVEAKRSEIAENKKVGEQSVQLRRRWKSLGGDSLTTDSAAAENQVFGELRDSASAAGVSLTNVKPERSERKQDFQLVTVRATATGSMNQIARMLYLIDKADIPLRVSEIRLTSRKENTDDLTLDLGVATIFLPARSEATR